MMLGAQVLRGFAADSWTQYLDAAGYPRESRLPSTYQYRPRRRSPASRRGRRAGAGRRRQCASAPPHHCRSGPSRF